MGSACERGGGPPVSVLVDRPIVVPTDGDIETLLREALPMAYEDNRVEAPAEHACPECGHPFVPSARTRIR